MRFGASLLSAADDELIVTTPRGNFTRQDLGGQMAQASALLGEAGRNVAVLIATPDILSALPALAIADGRARRLGLVDARLPIDTLRRFCRDGGFDIIHTNRVDLSDLGVRISSNAAQLAELVYDAVENSSTNETEWALATSGTTGTPKLVRHVLASLTATTKPPRPGQLRPVWGLLYDFSRFAGLQVVLQSLTGGGVLVAPDVDTPLDERLAFFARHGVTHLSATPTLWRKIIMLPQSRLFDLRSIALGGEIAGQKILDALRSRYPNARLTHIYASTEAGVGFAVSDGNEGFPVRFLETTPSGSDLRIVNDELQIRNSHIGRSYVGNETKFADQEGWVRTGDGVEIRGGRVLFRGRLNGTINVGGNKVLPEKVEQALKYLDNVAEAYVYGVPSSIAGMLVGAEIQLVKQVEDEAFFKKKVKRALSDSLDKHEIPAKLAIVENFAVNNSGKLVRK